MAKIKIMTEKGNITACVSQEETLLAALRKENVVLYAPCNGRGICGRCKVRIQGEEGERLACKTYPYDGMVVELVFDASKMEAVSEFCQQKQNQGTTQELGSDTLRGQEHNLRNGIAIDLGTTTVVLQLLRIDQNNHSYQVLQTIRSINPQSAYGADVISRITAANSGKKTELQECIQRLLCEGIHQLCHTSDLSLEEISQIAIAGNTTMMHLLRGYDVHGLGKYPFSPVNLGMEEMKSCELGLGGRANVTLFPGIAAFVGADITAGLFALKFHKKDSINLFLDLGTNGELAIGNKDRILVTSTAAGPAFEGGNLSCGIGSIPGAIKEVTIKKRYVSYQTIDNRPAIGLCGSGAIDLLAELWNKGYLDEHGSFVKQENKDNGFLLSNPMGDKTDAICFTQQDVRQMQLAKSAIRAGIEVLMNSYGVSYDKIEHLYLAGGMGFSLNIDKACAIGLIPMELKEKALIVGNSCLGGVISYLCRTEMNVCTELNGLLQRVEPIQLAEEELFTSNYFNYMDF